jgi:hypothetical protein
VLEVERAVDLAHTLFIVSSKSGTTTEPNTFYAYFWDRVQRSGAAEPGRQFVAVTDAGTSLEKLGKERGFRRVFTNNPEIGGRYSALSYFGLVPAALAGVDVKSVLERTRVMAAACGSEFAPRDNPGVWLGTLLGELALAGRDKVTFLPSPSLESFGIWGEQLLAESTGKEGKGLIPVAGEDAGEPDAYGIDRVFVHIHVKGDRDGTLERRLKALEEAGHPVIRLEVHDPLDIGAEFFRWEYATAVAGAVLGINPFDQPNVQESKDNTKRLLSEFEQAGRLPEPAMLARQNGVALASLGAASSKAGSRGNGVKSNGRNGHDDFAADLAAFLRDVRPGDYLAIMAYLPYDAAIDKELQRLRLRLRDALTVATTVGYGPRFLHSTGQLHKGGPNSGVFIQFTARPQEDLPVPGEPFSFGVLEAAQALGDLQSLQQHRRRAIRLQIDGDVLKGLRLLAPREPARAART